MGRGGGGSWGQVGAGSWGSWMMEGGGRVVECRRREVRGDVQVRLAGWMPEGLSGTQCGVRGS